MAKIKNLSSDFNIPIAEKELKLQMGQIPMGSQQGGLSLFSNKFKRGYGDAVFGSDENGIWLGGAEFAGSPFNVGMDGALAAKSATFKDEEDTTIIDAKGLVSTASFTFDNYFASNAILTTSITYVDVAGSLLEFTLARAARVLFILSVNLTVSNFAASGWSDAFVTLNIDTADRAEIRVVNAIADQAGQGGGGFGTHKVVELGAGEHTAKIRWKVGAEANNRAIITDRSLTYLVLGK